MDFTDGRTPYDILELCQGPAATEAEIRKAYKVLALKKHPDKNKNNPNAAAEFAELEKAYRVLTDASARGALDDYLNAKQQRAQRLGEQSDKRRKMREELEKREKEATTGRSEEAVARSRLQQELERLRKKFEMEAAATAVAAAAAAQQASNADGTGKNVSDDTQQQLHSTLKVSWDPVTRDYAASELRAIFSAHGAVLDVVVRERKQRKPSSHKPSSALVVMSSKAEADRAVNAVNGDVQDPLLVVPLLKVAPGATAAPNSAPNSAPASPKLAQPVSAQQPSSPMSTATASAAAATQPGQPLFPAGLRNGIASTTLPTSSLPAFPVAGAATIPTTGTPAASLFPGGVQGPGSSNSTPVTGGFSSFPGFGGGGPGGPPPVFVSSTEDAILQKMRRVAERERQLAAARAEDGAG